MPHKSINRQSRYNHVIDNIQDYMLTTSLYTKYLVNESQKPNNKHIKKSNSNRITIKEHDLLFWYFFIAKEGYDEYQLIRDNKFTMEKQIKISNIEKMRQNNNILKQQKIKICDYESDLLNSKKISLTTLCGLSAYNNINIIFVNDKTFYHFNFNDSDETIIIYKEGKTYSCEINPTLELIQTVKNNHYHIENTNKPIKAISNYKLNDIKDICKKLDIKTLLESGKPKNKKQMYQEILTYL